MLAAKESHVNSYENYGSHREGHANGHVSSGPRRQRGNVMHKSCNPSLKIRYVFMFPTPSLSDEGTMAVTWGCIYGDRAMHTILRVYWPHALKVLGEASNNQNNVSHITEDKHAAGNTLGRGRDDGRGVQIEACQEESWIDGKPPNGLGEGADIREHANRGWGRSRGKERLNEGTIDGDPILSSPSSGSRLGQGRSVRDRSTLRNVDIRRVPIFNCFQQMTCQLVNVGPPYHKGSCGIKAAKLSAQGPCPGPF
ncbi:hypothetical protein VNO77_15237 [Canavalia gladiata]|uniref:Uncharacterized protein n=1 Tax=Canavalia gladiata TaxID=3824 RepID=A0AAN9M2H4_CANGL